MADNQPPDANCEHRKQGRTPGDRYWICLDCGALIDGDDLGREYGRKMFAPIELTPEDEEKVADLLQHNDGDKRG